MITLPGTFHLAMCPGSPDCWTFLLELMAPSFLSTQGLVCAGVGGEVLVPTAQWHHKVTRWLRWPVLLPEEPRVLWLLQSLTLPSVLAACPPLQ